MDQILFQNQFLAIIERDGYTFSREVRCDGVIVSIVPFRVKGNALEFLARLEVCPAHGPDLQLCSITGGLNPNERAEETAQKELWEETGYQVKLDELIPVGQVRPSKSADTTAHLFAVDLTGKAHATPLGDGSRFEADASVQWVDFLQGLEIKDPLFITAMTRLLNKQEKSWRFQA